jgi:hypothetical protein
LTSTNLASKHGNGDVCSVSNKLGGTGRWRHLLCELSKIITRTFHLAWLLEDITIIDWLLAVPGHDFLERPECPTVASDVILHIVHLVDLKVFASTCNYQRTFTMVHGQQIDAKTEPERQID